MEDAHLLELFVGTKVHNVADAPAGLIVTVTGNIIMKTEYYEQGYCTCYNMAGECCVNLDTVECKSLIIK